jgi:hypothetical protein
MRIQSAFEQAGIRFLDNYATGEIVPLLEKNASKSCETAPRLINGGTAGDIWPTAIRFLDNDAGGGIGVRLTGPES